MCDVHKSAGLEHDEPLECKHLCAAGGETSLPARVGPRFLQDLTCLELTSTCTDAEVHRRTTDNTPSSGQ